MADFETTIEEVRDLNENLNALNSTVVKTIEAFGGEVKKATKTLDNLSQKQQSAAKELEKKIEADKRARNYVKELAEVQYEASKQSRSFGRKMDDLAGESVEFHKGLMRARDILGSLVPLGRGITDFGKSLYAGKFGAASGAKVFEGLGESAFQLGKQFGILGTVLGGTVMLFAKYIGAAARQADDLYKGFQDLGKVGGATSRGFTDLRENLRGFRYGIEEIDKMVRLVGANAPGLAMFSGSVAKGTKAVSQIAAGITRSDLLEQFMNMGVNLDEINENAFAFATLQARTGGMQTKTQTEATEALRKYITETDAITRLLGANRKEQEEARNAAMQVDAFRREQVLAMQSDNASQRDAAKKALETFNILYQMGPEGKRLALAFAQSRRGVISGAEGIKAAMLGGSELISISQDDTLSSVERAEKIAQIMARNADTLGGTLADVNRFSDVFGFSYGGLQDVGVMSKNLAKRLEGVTDEQERSKIIQESVVQSMTGMNISSMNSRDNMQDFVNKGVQPATYALEKLTYIVEKLTSLLPGGPPTGAAQQANVIAQRKAAAGGAGYFGQMMAGAKAGLSATFGGQPAGTLGSIRDLIASVESGGDYNVLVGGGRENLENMTLSEIFELQKRMLAGGRESTAVGRYQFTQATLARMAKKLGMDPQTTKFDRSTQDALADALIKEMGYDRYLMGTLGREEFLKNLSSQWAGLPAGPSGKSYYAGVGSNKAGVGYAQAIASLSEGGIVAGPRSGYAAQLHGTEAVVPLPDGRTIPVTMPDLSNGMREQVTAMGAQISRLDELISLMRNQNNISSKILQYSTG